MWDSLSGDTLGLYFTVAAEPRQCSLSLARVPWDRKPATTPIVFLIFYFNYKANTTQTTDQS
jgi:hypothetical protein